MCFSAEASFGAGAVLSVAGIITMRKVKEASHLAFAAIPLFFGIQQITEGFVWVTLQNDAYAALQEPSIYLFSFFSHILWPIWVPFAVLLFEKDPKKKSILFGIFSVAILLAIGEVYNISTYGVQARIEGQHIQYFINFSGNFILISDIFYALVTLIPCFISSHKKMRLFSVALIATVIIAIVFYKEWLISVWCFFAAMLSVIVYSIIKHITEEQESFKTV